nr:hypothetical protein CFP56_21530 [Quercus suber]
MCSPSSPVHSDRCSPLRSTCAAAAAAAAAMASRQQAPPPTNKLAPVRPTMPRSSTPPAQPCKARSSPMAPCDSLSSLPQFAPGFHLPSSATRSAAPRQMRHEHSPGQIRNDCIIAEGEDD